MKSEVSKFKAVLKTLFIVTAIAIASVLLTTTVHAQNYGNLRLRDRQATLAKALEAKNTSAQINQLIEKVGSQLAAYQKAQTKILGQFARYYYTQSAFASSADQFDIRTAEGRASIEAIGPQMLGASSQSVWYRMEYVRFLRGRPDLVAELDGLRRQIRNSGYEMVLLRTEMQQESRRHIEFMAPLHNRGYIVTKRPSGQIELTPGPSEQEYAPSSVRSLRSTEEALERFADQLAWLPLMKPLVAEDSDKDNLGELLIADTAVRAFDYFKTNALAYYQKLVTFSTEGIPLQLGELTMINAYNVQRFNKTLQDITDKDQSTPIEKVTYRRDGSSVRTKMTDTQARAFVLADAAAYERNYLRPLDRLVAKNGTNRIIDIAVTPNFETRTYSTDAPVDGVSVGPGLQRGSFKKMEEAKRTIDARSIAKPLTCKEMFAKR